MTKLTPLELDIMKSLWRRQHASVREVQADLLPKRPLAYTTVMTLLDRLHKKGAVYRTKRSRAHVYQPTLSESEARAAAVALLLDSFFEGSAGRLENYLGGRATPGQPEPESPVPAMDDSLL